MSFVKKAVKKVVNFVKKHWKTIVFVAAVVFTAGVATVGFSAFAGASGFGSFMGAVGKTMVAGVQGIGAAFGIGSGATAAGGAKVGLGAAWGAGGGTGWATGSAAAKIAASQAAAKASTLAPVAVTGTKIAGAATPTAAQMKAMGATLPAAGTSTATTAAAAGGTTVGTVLKAVSAVGGPALTAYAKMKEAEAQNAPPLAVWGVEVGREDEYYDDIIGGGDPNAVGSEALAQTGTAPLMPGGAPVGSEALDQVGVPGAQQQMPSSLTPQRPDTPGPLMPERGYA